MAITPVDTPQPAAPRRRWMPSLTTQIFLGLILGIALGYLFPSSDVGGAHVAGLGEQLRPLATVFLRMIKMIIAPLLFSTLVIGIAGTGDMKAMGRIAVKALVFFELATTVALFLGLGLVNFFKPGAGLSLPAESAAAVSAIAARPQTGWDILIHLFPTSIFDAMATGDILQVVVFSVFFGIGLAAVGKRGQPVLDFLDGVAHVMFKFTGYVMMFAPIGVMAAIAATVGARGLGILATLSKLVVLMYVGLAVFVVVVFWITCRIVRVPFMNFLKASREPSLIAFTTASSEAALPKALELMERFGVPKSIVSLVIPTGYSFNLIGTTLYLSLCSVFVAQLFNVPMSFERQLVMMLTLMLTSKGVAGVPRAALVVLLATLSSFNLPVEGAAILLGIDQIMDMGRTGVNVMGNCLATVVVARWERTFDDGQMREFLAQHVE
jgi:proton glutamate symport protein